MGDTTESLTFVVRAQDQASSVFKTAGERAKESIDKLKKVTGEDSAFGGALKIAAGAGAIAGVGLLARGLADAGRSLAELNQEGDKTRTEISDKFVEMIPIIGNVVTAWDEAFTGRRFAEKMEKELRASIRKIRDDIRSLAEDAQIGSLSGSSKAIAEVERKRNEALLADRREAQDKLAGLSPEQGEKLKVQYAALAAAREADARRQIKEIQANARRDELIAEQEHNQRLLDMEQEYHTARLKAVGQGVAATQQAEREDLAATFEQRRRAVDARVMADTKDEKDPKRIEAAAAMARDELAKINDLEIAAREDLGKKQNKDILDKEDERRRSLNEALASAERDAATTRVKDLRDVKHMELEARLAEIEQASKEEMQKSIDDLLANWGSASLSEKAKLAARVDDVNRRRLMDTDAARKDDGKRQAAAILNLVGVGGVLGTAQDSIASYVDSVRRNSQLQANANQTIDGGGGTGLGAAFAQRDALAVADQQAQANETLKRIEVQQQKANLTFDQIQASLAAFGVKVGVK